MQDVDGNKYSYRFDDQFEGLFDECACGPSSPAESLPKALGLSAGCDTR